MAKCCICGKEANHYALGLGWCEKHYEYVEKRDDLDSGKGTKLQVRATERRKASVDFELDWI